MTVKTNNVKQTLSNFNIYKSKAFTLNDIDKTKKKKISDQELIMKYNEARKEGNKQLEDYYFSELEKTIYKLLSKGIKVANYDMLYPWYSEDFFAEMKFQLLRRISDYESWLRLDFEKWKPWNRLWNNGKNEEKEKKFNLKSLIIALGKYVHEELIYKYNDKSISRKEMRKSFKDWTFKWLSNSLTKTNWAMHNSIEREYSLIDSEDVSLVCNSVDSIQNSNINENYYLYDFLLDFLKKNDFSRTQKSIIFNKVSREQMISELEENHLSSMTIKAFQKMSRVMPNFKNLFNVIHLE